MSKEYLKQIKKIETLIRNKTIEQRQEEKLGVDASYIRNEIKQMQGARASIIADIQKLKEPEYDVLHRIYVQGETLYEVADARGISYSMATTIHGRALKNLADIIEGNTYRRY